MITMFKLVLILPIALSMIGPASSLNVDVEINDLSTPLTNLQFHDNKFYIGGQDNIYVLDKDLSIHQEANTCKGSVQRCNNENSLLLVSAGKYLITCGTANDGRCEVRNLTNIGNVTKNRPQMVSSDINRPVQGIVSNTDRKLMLAVTFGKGLPTTPVTVSQVPYNSYKYAISEINPVLLSSDDFVYLNIMDSFVVYYKSSFQSGDYNYFTTIQKESSKKTMYTSKLVRLCQNNVKFQNYIDLPINCMSKGSIYNMLQTAVLADTKSGKVFIGAFTRDSDPEIHESESVICTENLNEMDELMNNALKSFVTSNVTRDTTRYLPDTREDPIQDEGIEEFLLCNMSLPTAKYAIGRHTHNIQAAYKINEGNGYVTSLHATKLDGYDVVYAGTSQGLLYQFNLMKDSMTLFDKHEVDKGSGIKGIQEDRNSALYVMSTSKIIKYNNTDCSEFKTCQETMEKKNPHCGWCVYQNSSETEISCPSEEWIHSHKDCIYLKTDISGIAVGTTGKNVKITATNFVKRKNNADEYKCRFSTGQTPGAAMATDNTFTCDIPVVNVHTDATLELMVNDVVLASTPFLFYKCGHFKRCKECVSTEGSMCTWSLTKPECVVSGQNGGIALSKAFVGEVGQCPRLEDNSDLHYIPAGEQSPVTIRGSNLPNESLFWCYIEENGHEASIDGDKITCYLTVSLKNSTAHKENKRVVVKYGQSETSRKDLDDDHNLTVTVYSCDNLAEDCSHCKGLNTSRYKCRWCSGSCQHTNSCSQHEACPAPFIREISPSDGPAGGNTTVTIEGTNLGTNLSNIDVEIGTYTCNVNENISFPENDDFELDIPNRIECTIEDFKETEILTEKPRNVKVIVNGDLESNQNVSYTFKVPTVTGINPSSGPQAGGTRITISGKNLGIGSKNWEVLLDSKYCNNTKVKPVSNSNLFTIECVTPDYAKARNLTLRHLKMDGNIFPIENIIIFETLTNPNISEIEGKKGGFLKGGTILTILGTDLHHANVGVVKFQYKNDKVEEKCVIESNAVTKCLIPVAPQSLRNDVMAKVNRSSNRRKRAACDGCIEVTVTVKLDGVEKDFIIKYVQDPTVQKLSGDGNVLLYETDEHQLILKGDALDLVTIKTDFRVSIGTANCTVIELTRDTLTCKPPTSQPTPANPKRYEFPEVEVYVGNIHERVGYLQYQKTVELFIIALAAGGGALLILMIIIVVGIVKYKKMRNKATAYEKNLIDMEMEIKTVARQEFLDMHTTMSSVNKNLVEQGFPYHSYQQFACNVMFSVDYLWTEPVVSNGKMTDDERLKANRGMESLESLIYNKFFLVSVISTMENEKRFFIREKSNLAGNLCAVLMGRMDYLDEILKLLMNNLVQDSPARKHKALFRRCESITEKLLSNWLSLCLYPHVKSHSGSPLYLLYMATQKTMESGPIDAVTGDAKYTLSEEKLLKKWSSSMDDDNDQDLKFEAKTLTLNVVVDNGEEIFKCKVLDCDTISQVKNKCLNQIYVNFPASKLPVGANDLELEWHEGFGGTLKLRDEDNTSKREGKWVRFNTLAHYNVKDESNMALIDPHSTDNNLEDYVNLANINMDGVCDGSIDSSQPLTLHDPENPHECEQWHLIKKEEESSKQGKGAITELYLNRLFTTKQSLMEYMRPLFDIILDHDKCPPPTKFLYDYLDELGEKYKVDVETVHAWKSHSYAIRVWASLMKMPNLLFDVSIPSFMDDNLEIISQVFIESFSLSTQKFTKDTPPQKLIFHHERNHYKDRVKEFYKNVKVDPQDSEGFRQYMADVNRLQQATEFNKVSALYRFYKQLKPYFEDIIDNLATNKEASNLQLDRKLEQVIAIMEEDD